MVHHEQGGATDQLAASMGEHDLVSVNRRKRSSRVSGDAGDWARLLATAVSVNTDRSSTSAFLIVTVTPGIRFDIPSLRP